MDELVDGVRFWQAALEFGDIGAGQSAEVLSQGLISRAEAALELAGGATGRSAEADIFQPKVVRFERGADDASRGRCLAGTRATGEDKEFGLDGQLDGLLLVGAGEGGAGLGLRQSMGSRLQRPVGFA